MAVCGEGNAKTSLKLVFRQRVNMEKERMTALSFSATEASLPHKNEGTGNPRHVFRDKSSGEEEEGVGRGDGGFCLPLSRPASPDNQLQRSFEHIKRR